MESQFEKRMDEIFESPGVVGTLCADKLGLCVGVRGKALHGSSGLIANIADKASQIEPSNEEQPVVLFESNNIQCLIQKDDSITLAIIKTPTN